MAKTVRSNDVGRRGPLPARRLVILDWIRSRIVSGELRPGDRLPDRTWFAKEFSLATHSVQMAFSELEADGLVHAVPGHGTHVADKLPFVGRYLLLLRSRQDDAGVNFFAPALREAARLVAEVRGVTFDVRELVDVPGDSFEYAQLLSDLAHQHYAGVIAQGVTEEEHGLDVFTNVNNVPMVFFGEASQLTQGDLVKPLTIYGPEWEEPLYGRHFAGLQAKGCSHVAVFRPNYHGCVQYEFTAKIAAKYGLTIVRNGYHLLDMSKWDPDQFVRWMELFLNSDAGNEADAIVFGDDNMLEPFATAAIRQLGPNANSRYAISCHCNFPVPPKSDISVEFHGPDLIAAFQSLVDYADDCHNGVKKPRVPALKVI